MSVTSILYVRLNQHIKCLLSACGECSPNGLILTNHHVGFETLAAVSSPEKNYGKDGYRNGLTASDGLQHFNNQPRRRRDGENFEKREKEEEMKCKKD